MDLFRVVDQARRRYGFVSVTIAIIPDCVSDSSAITAIMTFQVLPQTILALELQIFAVRYTIIQQSGKQAGAGNSERKRILCPGT